MKVIIPCCGYGTRLGMPKTQSKEMLKNKSGIRLIDNILDLCAFCNWTPHIVTRKEKKDLIKHLNKKGIVPQIIKPKGEWQDTVLASEPFWEEQNLLVLPDTNFSTMGFYNIANYVRLKKVTLFTHSVNDGHNWGIVKQNEKTITITEKPKKSKKAEAWGLIAFNKMVGKNLFCDLKNGKTTLNKDDVLIWNLSFFQDMTRDKKILEWQCS